MSRAALEKETEKKRKWLVRHVSCRYKGQEVENIKIKIFLKQQAR